MLPLLFSPFLAGMVMGLTPSALPNYLSADDVNLKNFDHALVVEGGEHAGYQSSSLPLLASAPDFAGIERWVNSDPLTIGSLRGKVVLIDFWTYSCINCIRTRPHLNKWYETYRDKGLVIVGIHSPEFPFEKVLSNVQSAVKRFGISYPVGLDNEFKTWDNYGNSYWPAHYLIDRNGVVRSFGFGEGKYLQTENQIRELLGMMPLAGEEEVKQERPITQETYVGSGSGIFYPKESNPVIGSEEVYGYQEPLSDDQVALKGQWTVSERKITSRGDRSVIDLNFIGTKVYLVMDADSPQLGRVFLDGQLLPEQYYTKDMDHRGRLMIKEGRKYDLVDLKGNYGRHLLSLELPAGVSAYTFTFGEE